MVGGEYRGVRRGVMERGGIERKELGRIKKGREAYGIKEKIAREVGARRDVLENASNAE